MRKSRSKAEIRALAKRILLRFEGLERDIKSLLSRLDPADLDGVVPARLLRLIEQDNEAPPSREDALIVRVKDMAQSPVTPPRYQVAKKPWWRVQ